MLLYITKTSSGSISISLTDDPWEVTWFPGFSSTHQETVSLSLPPSVGMAGLVEVMENLGSYGI